MKEVKTMAIGPVQMLVIGFEDPDFHGQIYEELKKVREAGIIRLIDLQFVYKDEDGNIDTLEATDLSDEERQRFGAVVGGLIGYGAAGERGARAGAELGAVSVAEHDYGIAEVDIDAIGDAIPKNSAAAFLLIEHHWAIGFRDALRSAGGVLISQGMITPELLLSVGEALAEAVEAEEREEQAMEKRKVAAPAR
jgi:uncharacterized membrane protein